MYNKIVKNNQVTYGNPFQLKIPVNLKNILLQEELKAAEEEAAAASEAESVADIIARAREEAEMITKEAEYEAARIVESAQNEANVRAGEIEEKAWQKGYSEGMENARQQNEALLQETESIRNSAVEDHDRIIARMEAEIIEMTLDIAKKVIGSEFLANQENMLYIVRQAIEKCSNKSNIVLKVSKEDHSFLNENIDRLLSMVQGVGGIELKQDLSLKPGDCIVETSFGSIDAGMQKKISKIEEAFRELLNGMVIPIGEE